MIGKLASIFSRKDYWLVVAIVVMNVFGAFAELLGIGAALPLIAAVAQPTEASPMVAKLLGIISSHIHIAHNIPPLLLLGGLFLLVLVVKNVFLFTLLSVQCGFLARKATELAGVLYASYLERPYSRHLRTNSATLQQHSECVFAVVNGMLFPMLVIASESVVLVVVVIAMFMIDTRVTGGVMLFFPLFVGLGYWVMRGRLRKWGEKRNVYRSEMIKAINQGLGAIKETKILHREPFFVSHYTEHMSGFVRMENRARVLSQAPRYYIETVVALMIFAWVAFFAVGGEITTASFMKISFFAVAAIRIMPSCARISASLGTMRIYSHALDLLTEDLREAETLARSERQSQASDSPSIGFESGVRMDDVCFGYNGDDSTVAIRDLALEFAVKESVAFVGKTGAGKTTTVDLLVGLLKPTSGKVLVDGVDIHSNIRSWWAKIGYVPQNVYLIDDTIRRNIAFGVSDDEIDDGRVRNAVKLAQLDSFVDALPEKLDTVVGERGARVSGGERQRIGIARALYRNPDVLVLDEATAALDNETERAFMGAIDGLTGKKTIVVIAHRLSTVRRCDNIFLLSDGKLAAEGTYDYLLKNSAEFAAMASSEESFNSVREEGGC